MSREKLKSLGIDLPLLPTTTVGSLPKPDYILKARASFARGEIDYTELENLERKATEFWVRKQDEIGLDVIVDSEMYRGDMVAFFAETMMGFDRGGLVRSYGNRYYRKPIISGEVRWFQPITVKWWQFAQSLTSKPVKGMVTGPYTIMDWSFNEYYPTREKATIAIAHGIRKEVETLIASGAKIIQVDEPAISTRIEEMDFARNAMRIVTQGLNAYFICHICYGDFAPVYKHMLSLEVDNLDLETSLKTSVLKAFLETNVFDKDVSYGVLDVHSHLIEGTEEVKERIKQALSLFDSKALWIDPDCGLKTRLQDEAVAKLENMVKAVRQLRQN